MSDTAIATMGRAIAIASISFAGSCALTKGVSRCNASDDEPWSDQALTTSAVYTDRP